MSLKKYVPGAFSFRHIPAFKSIKATLRCCFQWLALLIPTSFVIGSASAFFLWSLSKTTALFETQHWLILTLPITGFGVGLLYYYKSGRASEGVSLIIDEVRKPTKTLPFRMAPFVLAGTLLTHLSGGSAGREGTALQMAASLGDQLRDRLKLYFPKRSTILITAMAAGFGSVFGTPVAGAFFALEITAKKRLRYDALFAALPTAFLASKVTSWWGVPHTHYHIEQLPAASFSSIAWCILAGILSGCIAWLFKYGLKNTSSWFKKLLHYPPLRPLAGGLIVMLLVVISGQYQYAGLGIAGIKEAFVHPAHFYGFAFKMLLTIITIGAGFKGGEVTPLFFIGASLGSALSLVLPLPVDFLAGIGFVAVFAGATRTPLACSFIAMEIFGIQYGLFMTIACWTAFFFSGRSSIYDKAQAN